MAVTPTTMNPTNKAAIAPTAATSKEVRRVLGLSLHGWENAMVISLIIAGFFALIVGAATWAVVRLQRIELAESKRELDEYKLTVEGKVADAKREGIEAGKMAGNALVRAEELRAANLALEAQIMPRRLTSQQQQSISSALARFAGRRMRIKSYALDVEAAVLGQQIIATLQAANIGGDDRRMSVGALGAIAIGIHVTGDDKELIDATLAAFSSVGLAVSPEPVPIITGMALSDDGTPVAAIIFVGVKPPAQ
jgi:hypothetical protein